jgi:hypothetical protein
MAENGMSEAPLLGVISSGAAGSEAETNEN